MLRDQFEAKPEVMGGKVCFKGTRVPLYVVESALEEGMTDEEILADWPSLTPEHLAAAKEYFSGGEDGWCETRVA